MAGRARTAIDLRVGAISEADLRVRSVRGREALSEPFHVFRGLSVEQLRKAQAVQDERARGA